MSHPRASEELKRPGLDQSSCFLPALNSFQPRMKIKTSPHRRPILSTSEVPKKSSQVLPSPQLPCIHPRSVLLDEPKAPQSLLKLTPVEPLTSAESMTVEVSRELEVRRPRAPSRARQDPYFIGNLVKSSDFTMLDEIMSWNEDNCYVNLLCLKYARDGSPSRLQERPQAVVDTSCNCESHSRHSWLLAFSMQSAAELLAIVPSLTPLKLKIRNKVQHPKKVIVFNIEGLLIDRGFLKKEWVLRPKLARTLQKLQFFFQLAFAYESGYPGTLPFLRLLKQEGIKPSALYEIAPSGINATDYTQVTRDFETEDVLVVSALALPYEEAEYLHGEELVLSRHGTQFKVLANRAPVTLHGPGILNLLVPQLAGNQNAISAFSIARMILLYKDEPFANLAQNEQLESFCSLGPTWKVFEERVNLRADSAREIRIAQQCPLNLKTEELTPTNFAVMKLSKFMNSNGPLALG